MSAADDPNTRQVAPVMPLRLAGVSPAGSMPFAHPAAVPPIKRPVTRGDCANVPRPCPFVSCSSNLYLDINEKSGKLKLTHPHLEPDQMTESCALDVADHGGIVLEEIGALMGITRERTRQIEERALYKLRLKHPHLKPPAPVWGRR